MPNTRADLDRLKHHWEHDHGAWDPEHGDEMIALCERLLLEREDSAQEVRYCHGMQIKADDLAAALLLEIGRYQADRDNLRAELIERCELLERMASPDQCFLAVSFSDHPGVGAIHFASDADLIYGPKPEATNDEKPQEG